MHVCCCGSIPCTTHSHIHTISKEVVAIGTHSMHLSTMNNMFGLSPKQLFSGDTFSTILVKLVIRGPESDVQQQHETIEMSQHSALPGTGPSRLLHARPRGTGQLRPIASERLSADSVLLEAAWCIFINGRVGFITINNDRWMI